MSVKDSAVDFRRLVHLMEHPVATYGTDGRLTLKNAAWELSFGDALDSYDRLGPLPPLDPNRPIRRLGNFNSTSIEWQIQPLEEGCIVIARPTSASTGLPAAPSERSRLFNLFMKAPAPISLLRGPEFAIEFANEYWRMIVGVTREVDGIPLKVALPDLEEGLLAILNQVYMTGERFIGAEFPITLDFGARGKPETRYFSFIFEPMTDLLGKVEGVMSFGFEVTDQIRARDLLQKTNDELERRVRDRTVALSSANQELEAFSYSVSHDLRSPLRGIDGFSQALLEDYSDRLDDTGKNYLGYVRSGVQRMGDLIDDLLRLSRLSRTEVLRNPVDLTKIAEAVVKELRQGDPSRKIEVVVQPSMQAVGDAGLIQVALQNLVGNAWKFTSKTPDARIEIGECQESDGTKSYFVKDNGAGFDMSFSGKLFGAFQRLHSPDEGYTGTGIGLATSRRIIHRHGGRIWAEGKVGAGATFHFTL